MKFKIKKVIMRKHVKIAALLILGIGIMSSCVSKKKYEELESQRMELNQELDEAKSTISDLQDQNEEIQNRSAELESDLEDLTQRMTQVKNPVETASPVGVSADPVEAVEGALVGEILFDICPMKLFDRIGIAREVGMALRQAS